MKKISVIKKILIITSFIIISTILAGCARNGNEVADATETEASTEVTAKQETEQADESVDNSDVAVKTVAEQVAEDDTLTDNQKALLTAIEKVAEERISRAGMPLSYDTGISESSQNRRDYPEVFDLRAVDTDGDGKTENYVTSVKDQHPFGTCWAFASIAAAETSILYELGQDAVTTDEDGNPCDSINLSEHQLAWFTYTPMPEGDTQAGEGLYSQIEGADKDTTGRMDSGSNQFAATQMFASGVGPKEEFSYYEATGTNAELSYHGKNRKENNGSPSIEDDWSVDESLRYVQSYMLENSHYLPAPVKFDDDGNYDIEYAEMVTKAYKEELMKGHPVTIAFCADTYMPGKVNRAAEYINSESGSYAHYCYEPIRANHAVTIIGWDDNYSLDNYLTEVQEKDEEGKLLYNEDGSPKMKTVAKPPKTGAWIVKNSWGGTDSIGDGPNTSAWGYQGSGYFYLSFYDQSIETAQCFDFDVKNELRNELGQYVIQEYDFMPSEIPSSVQTEFPVAIANAFTAEADEEIKAVSCTTTREGEVILIEIYKLIDETKPVGIDNVELVCEYAEGFEASGLHVIRLPRTYKFKEGEKFVVLTIQKADGYSIFSVGSEFNQKGFDAGYTDDNYAAKAVVNPGESYIYLSDDRTWWDFAEVKELLEASDGATGYMTYDNFPIKVYASILD